MEGLFLVLMFVSFICFMWSLVRPNTFAPIFFNKLQKGGIRLALGLAIPFFFIAFGVASDINQPSPKNQEVASPEKNPSAEQPAQQQAITQPTAQKQADNNQAPKEEAKPQTTQDKLWIALDNSMKTRNKYEISYDENKKEAQITFSPTDLWDENSAVRGAYTTLVKYGREAFKLEGVDILTVNYRTEFTDSYGKKNMEDAVIVSMNKEEFNKYDWNNLKYQSVYRQIEGSSLKHYIHPAIAKNLNYEKLYLSF